MDKRHASSSDSGTIEEVKANYDKLMFSTRRSVRYHSKRSAFFGKWEKAIQILSLFSGMGAFVSALGTYRTVMIISSLLIAFLSSVNLVIGFGDKERKHDDLKRRWIDLEDRMQKNAGQIDENRLAGFKSDRLKIEADEPKVIRTLDMLCHDEEVTSQGFGDHSNLNAIRRAFCNFDLPFLNPAVKK